MDTLPNTSQAYLKLANLYFQHLCQLIALARHPDGIRWYMHPDFIKPIIEDALLMKQEIDGANIPNDTLTALWGRAHDRGFI